MTRRIVLSIIGYALLSLVLASVFHLVFSDVLPYAAGEHDASAWTRPVALLIATSVWLGAGIAGTFVIVLAARLYHRGS